MSTQNNSLTPLDIAGAINNSELVAILTECKNHGEKAAGLLKRTYLTPHGPKRMRLEDQHNEAIKSAYLFKRFSDAAVAIRKKEKVANEK